MTKKLILDIEDLWEKFKATVTKDKKLNDAVVELIGKSVYDNKRGNS